MPVWLSLLVAVVATVGFFVGLYAVVIGLVEGKRVQARPRLGIGSGSRPGTFTYWVTWDTNTFNVQIYRLRVSLYNPDGDPKEGVFTVTYDPVIKAPFQQEVEFPPVFAKILESQQAGKRGIITIDFRTVDETTLPADFSFEKMRRISQGQGAKPPKLANVLPPAQADAAPVMTLDYSELVVRRKKIRDLEAAAKAKAAKAAAAPPKAAAAGAAAPAPAAATAAKAPAAAAVPAGSAAPTNTAAKPEAAPSAPAPAVAAKPAPAPAPADKAPSDVPSIKAVIAKANAQNKEKG